MALEEIKNSGIIYFTGIGGISMSGLALILKHRGYSVSGSDIKVSDATLELERKGIHIDIGQKTENINESISTVIYTAAISADNPELIEAKRRGIALIPRSKLLGFLLRKYDDSIAVAGTHGKTTTTSMVAQILLEAELDPTVSIGGIMPSISSNIRIGSSDYFVAEACEYTNSFLELYPKVAIVLNADLDHIDYFKNIEEVRASFRNFISNISDEGAVVINGEMDNIPELTNGKNTIIYGFDSSADWYAKDIVQGETHSEFDIYRSGELLGRAQLSLPGRHNISNSLAAAAASSFLGVDDKTILSSISKFSGTKRRFELKGCKNGFTVYDDYAHHPSEIKATLQAAATRFKGKKIYCVFQPHTFSRTKAFINEFSDSFGDAAVVVLADIYAAREKDDGEVNSQMLLAKLIEKGKSALHFDGFSKIENYLLKNVEKGDIVITMGAGNINVVGENLLK